VQWENLAQVQTIFVFPVARNSYNFTEPFKNIYASLIAFKMLLNQNLLYLICYAKVFLLAFYCSMCRFVFVSKCVLLILQKYVIQ